MHEGSVSFLQEIFLEKPGIARFWFPRSAWELFRTICVPFQAATGPITAPGHGAERRTPFPRATGQKFLNKGYSTHASEKVHCTCAMV